MRDRIPSLCRGSPLSLPIEPLQLAIALAVVTLGSAVQASVGLGLGLIAAPILLLLYPPFVPGPLMASGIVMVMLVAHRDRTHIDFAGLRYGLAGRVVGTLAAGFFLAVASTRVFDLVFGVLVLLAASISAIGFHVSPGPRNTAIAGALSGLMGTISAIGGPPLALLYQGEGTERLRGTLSGFFILGGSFTLLVLAGVGRFGKQEIVLAALLTPAAILGFLISLPLRDRVSSTAAQRLVIGLSMACGVTVLWRALA